MCTLFLGHTSADYFINTLTITSGQDGTTTVIPENPIVFSPNGNLLASGSTTGHVVLWNPETGEVVRRLDRGSTQSIGPQGIVFNDAGTKIAAGEWDQHVRVWNVETGTLLQTLNHEATVLSVVFAVESANNANNEILYSQGTTKVKRWKNGKNTHKYEVANREGAPNEVRVAMVATYTPPELTPWKRILIGRANGKIEVRRATNFDLLAESNPADDGVTSPVWSLTSQTYSYFMSGHADGKIRLWSTTATSQTTPGKTVKLWDRSVNTERLPYQLEEEEEELTHTGIVTSLAYSAPRLASGSSDGSVFVFDERETPAKLYHPDSDTTDNWEPHVRSVSYGFKGYKVATLASYADTVDGSNVIMNRNIQLWENRDANNDGELDRDDLVAIARNYGESNDETNRNFDLDIDGDESIDIDDIVLVAEAIDALQAAQGAPVQAQNTAQPVQLDIQKVQQILHDARQINADARVIALLEALLKAATLQQTEAPPPAKTALFTNYPNPFNPETWIPYELATPAEVTVDIHSATGQLVRTLRLGHQPAGMYRAQTHAAAGTQKANLSPVVSISIHSKRTSSPQRERCSSGSSRRPIC